MVCQDNSEEYLFGTAEKVPDERKTDLDETDRFHSACDSPGIVNIQERAYIFKP